MADHKTRAQRLAGIAILFLLLVIIALGVLFPPAEYLPLAQWGERLQSAGLSGAAALLFIGMLATSVGLPRQLLAFTGGLAYGVLPGLLLSLVAALCGCALTATVSRRFFSTWVSERFPKPIATLNRLLTDDLFLKILILRLQPLGTNLITNVCIGFTRASLPVFLQASAVGYIPQMLVFSLIGSGVRVGSQTQLVLSAGLLIVSIGLGVVLYKKKINVT